jgi:hypothetical protein
VLRALIFSGMWLAASASAQDVGVAWRFDAGTNDWRIADANERWVVLERDVAQPSGPQGELECTQEILVLRAETGAEVLRAPGWSQPIWTDVSAWFSLAVRPLLAGDRVIVLRDPTTLVALSLPDGRELWRAALPEGRWESAEMPLVVGGDRVLWLEDADIRALDAETGRQAFTLPAGAVRIAGSSIVHLAARSEMLRTFELETGRERARLSLGARHWPPVHFFASEAAVVVIDQDLRVLDPATLAVTARGPHVDPYRVSAIGDRLYVGDGRPRVLALPSLEPRGTVEPVELASQEREGLLTCTAGSIAMRSSDGRARWRWNVPECRRRLRYGARANVVAAGRLTIVHDGTTIVALSPDVAPDPAVELVVRGRVTFQGRALRRVRVRVAERSVWTDGQGRYRARARARGVFRVWIDAAEVQRATGLPCTGQEVSAVVGLDVASPHRVDLEPHAWPFPEECGEACRCDH